MPNNALLKGWHVVIMRQPHQAQALVTLVESLHGCPIVLPTVDIIPCVLSNAVITAGCARIQNAAHIIVVSQNAIQCAPKAWIEALQNSNAKTISMGKSTSQALAELNIPTFFTPEPGTTSESLLEATFLQTENIQGKNIVILAGEEGRLVLSKTLQARGAQVEMQLTYKQSKRHFDIGAEIARWSLSENFILTAFSSHSLEFFLTDLSKSSRDWSVRQPLIVMGERIAAQAKEWGFKHIAIAKSALPEDIKIALQKIV